MGRTNATCERIGSPGLPTTITTSVPTWTTSPTPMTVLTILPCATRAHPNMLLATEICPYSSKMSTVSVRKPFHRRSLSATSELTMCLTQTQSLSSSTKTHNPCDASQALPKQQVETPTLRRAETSHTTRPSLQLLAATTRSIRSTRESPITTLYLSRLATTKSQLWYAKR